MKKNKVSLTLPLDAEIVGSLRVGQRVLLSGTMYSARDAACALMFGEDGTGVPFPAEGGAIYFAGPSPAPPGRPVGSLGPTSSYRMEPFIPDLISAGIRAIIGKGSVGEKTARALRDGGCIYLAATGGAGALLSRAVETCQVAAFPELGAEALHRLEVAFFPALVAIDAAGGNLFRG